MAVFILILALAESACSRPYGIQETATITAEEAVIMAVTKSIIDDYFRTHEAKDNMGAFFLVVADGTESRFRGFMSDHHPRLEIGLSNLIKEGNGTYRDKLSGRSGALIHITLKLSRKTMPRRRVQWRLVHWVAHGIRSSSHGPNEVGLSQGKDLRPFRE